jgi:hypothetical protein
VKIAMHQAAQNVARSPLARLQRLARPRRLHERCELCGATIASTHQHLLELSNRQLVCACDACAILFSDEHATRYRRVPRDGRLLVEFELSDAMWESLHIPINLAFFYHDSGAKRVIAMYPSPAGATESLLTIESWAELTDANPALLRMQSDVEALLINRLGDRRDAFLVPIDQCYKLVGTIRAHWRGLSGGGDVWKEIARFFQDLHQRCAPLKGAAVHA